MVQRRLDCENCRHLTVVGLHDTGLMSSHTSDFNTGILVATCQAPGVTGSQEYITTANYRLQLALQVIESWAQSWLVKLNEKKTTLTIFGLSNQKHSVHLKLNRQTLHQEHAPAYLVVTLDRRLTWKNQLQKNQARAKIQLALMIKLSCTEWGADQNVLKKALCRENPPSS